MNNGKENKIDFLFQSIKRYDHYIEGTNTKASIMLSLIVAILFGLSLKAKEIFVKSIGNYIDIIYFSAYLFLSILSIYLIYELLTAIFPRTNLKTDKRSFLFSKDVTKWNNGYTGYYESISNATDEEILLDLSHQAHYMATALTLKVKSIHRVIFVIKYLVLPLLFLMMVLTLYTQFILGNST